MDDDRRLRIGAGQYTARDTAATLRMAEECAENEGWPPRTRVHAPKLGFGGRVVAFLRAEVARFASDDELTLDQLHERLLTLAARERAARTQLDRLITLVAIDVREASRFHAPTHGARSMGAWRQRYAGLERL